jgi:uncharacterized protein YndB with AHSA1/START domain
MDMIRCDNSIIIYSSGLKVFEVLLDVANYPKWWPSQIHFRFDEPGPLKVGSRMRIANGPLVKWTATVLEIVPDRLIRFSYCEGSWAGEAQWVLTNREGKTEVSYNIAICPAQRWLAWLAKLIDLGKLHSREMTKIL